MPHTRHCLGIGPVDFYKHRRAKRIKITIKPNHAVRVSLPWWTTYAQAERFVSEKKHWITQERSKLPAALEPQEIEKLRTEAKAYIPARVSTLAERGGFDYNRVTIKNMTSRWGSCSARKNLNFSLYLMRLPSEHIDYVIWHELCHTVHLHHGPAFWALLESVFPGARQIDKTIKGSVD